MGHDQQHHCRSMKSVFRHIFINGFLDLAQDILNNFLGSIPSVLFIDVICTHRPAACARLQRYNRNQDLSKTRSPANCQPATIVSHVLGYCQILYTLSEIITHHTTVQISNKMFRSISLLAHSKMASAR